MTTPGPSPTEKFVAAIRTALGPGVNENHEPVTGWQWTWTCRGVWTLTVGGLLTPAPHLVGPPGRWTMSSTALDQADLVLLLIQLADAMPTPPAPAPGAVTADRGTPVFLTPSGPLTGDLQQVTTPSGAEAMVSLSQTNRIVEPSAAGRLGVLIVEPVTSQWQPGQPIPATLYTSDPGQTWQPPR